MFVIIGYVVVLVAVFGGYWLAGGKFPVILKAAPIELAIIGGSAIGAFLVGNSTKVIKATIAAVPTLFKGSKYTKPRYMELMALLYEILAKARKEGLMSIEADVENPHDSPLFQKFPNISADHHLVEFITDYLRMMVSGNMNSHEIENLMDGEIETHHHEAHAPMNAIQGVGDGLPAFGIVAAVLGVVKTMASVGQPPAVLGQMIAGALVGTFLGVFLAYGLVGPFAVRLTAIIEEESAFYRIIQSVLVAHLHGNAAQISVEIGRGSVPSLTQPSFSELEEALQAIPPEA